MVAAASSATGMRAYATYMSGDQPNGPVGRGRGVGSAASRRLTESTSAHTDATATLSAARSGCAESSSAASVRRAGSSSA